MFFDRRVENVEPHAFDRMCPMDRAVHVVVDANILHGCHSMKQLIHPLLALLSKLAGDARTQQTMYHVLTCNAHNLHTRRSPSDEPYRWVMDGERRDHLRTPTARIATLSSCMRQSLSCHLHLSAQASSIWPEHCQGSIVGVRAHDHASKRSLARLKALCARNSMS